MITRLLGSGITSTVGGVNPCLADLKGDMYLIAGARQCTSVRPTGARAKIRRASLVFLRPEM